MYTHSCSSCSPAFRQGRDKRALFAEVPQIPYMLPHTHTHHTCCST